MGKYIFINDEDLNLIIEDGYTPEECLTAFFMGVRDLLYKEQKHIQSRKNQVLYESMNWFPIRREIKPRENQM